MGEYIANTEMRSKERATFIRNLLDDIKALDLMLECNLIESGVTRIGSEQEFCLVNDNWRPAINSNEILKLIDDPHFTTELARYNLEINLDPIEVKDNCFSQVENQLTKLINKARTVAKKLNTKVVLTGILPTISKSELESNYITPLPRYYALNDIMKEMRGSDFNLHISGVDELSLTHDSVLFEACNTSFQTHLQISPDDFIKSFNWAQAISGPLLGICTNSPLLLGRELWSETRISLFQQSIDTRTSSYALKDQQARVTYGSSWESGTVADIFKKDLSHYKVIITKPIDTNSLDELEKGIVPKLHALNLHNSTIYRWNRPCYGISDGKAHVRIENRYLPSGPSVVDEMANFALWVGIMLGRPKEYDHLPEIMDFRDAKANFFKAARTGKESVLVWMGEQISVRDLILKKLLPIAYTGLEKAKINKDDIQRLLGIIEERARGYTASQWIVKTYRKLRINLKQDDALIALTILIHNHQIKNQPVHTWPMLELLPKIHEASTQVRHIMSTQLFRVDQNDLADLATSVMQWNDIHHVIVENKAGKLVGLLTGTHMKRFQERHEYNDSSVVAEIMVTKVLSVDPKTPIHEAITIMKKHEIGCLPVIKDEHLVGIITIKDVIKYDHD
jgi:CBS domain-containing protein